MSDKDLGITMTFRRESVFVSVTPESVQATMTKKDFSEAVIGYIATLDLKESGEKKLHAKLVQAVALKTRKKGKKRKG